MNAVYGKFIENVKSYRVFRLCVGAADQQQKLMANPNWKNTQIIDCETTIEEFAPRTIFYNKALAVGLTILGKYSYVMNIFIDVYTFVCFRLRKISSDRFLLRGFETTIRIAD